MYSELNLKLTQFQQENERLKKELKDTKNNHSKKEAQSNAVIDELRSELLSEKQKLRLFQEKIVVEIMSSLEVIKTFETNIF